jgi:hypothetical protein
MRDLTKMVLLDGETKDGIEFFAILMQFLSQCLYGFDSSGTPTLLSSRHFCLLDTSVISTIGEILQAQDQ